jgi:hypothetical protein
MIEFALERCVVFDVEVFPDRWLVGFYGADKLGKLAIHQVEDRESLLNTLATINAAGNTLVGYNSAGYDNLIIAAILNGSDAFAASRDIIAGISRRRDVDIGVDHIDLAARLKRGGGFPGLKTVAANLGLTIEELPSSWFNEPVDSDRWEVIRRYNARDLISTYEILKRFAPELAALTVLSNELGGDLRSTPSPQVVEKFFLKSHREAYGTTPARIETPASIRYEPPRRIALDGYSDLVKRPRNKAAREWFDRVTKEPIRLTETNSGLSWSQAPKATFKLGKLTVSVGIGGIHSVDEPRLYRETKRRRLFLADVSSYYPSMIAGYGLTPRTYGEAGRDAYRRILERRLAIKKAAGLESDQERKAALAAEETGLKLLLNSTFGKLGDRYSSLFDPAAFASVTLTGQILLINLIERLQKAGARVVSCNTDGLVFLADRDDQAHQTVLRRWQSRTGLKLDVTPLKRFVALSTNNAAYLTSRGKTKSIGKLKTDLRPLASPNGLAIADAVVAAALFDIPPETTLEKITDPIRFAFVSRKTKKTRKAVLITGDQELELGKVSRWYRRYVEDGSPRPVIRHISESGRLTTPAKADGVSLMLDRPASIPGDIDRGFYIAEARRLYQRLDGLPKSRKLVEANPLAAEVYDRGLLPCPMIEKKSLKGRDAARPCLVWPWNRAKTIGVYSGPAAGLLVVDIDEPRKWKSIITDAGLFPGRLDDFAGSLVSARGVDPNEIRSGNARGKLIFRLDENESLALVNPTKFHKRFGVDLFYGAGIPAVLGAGKDGSRYTLDGELGNAPAWLVELFTRFAGSKRSSRPKSTPLFDYFGEKAVDDRFESLVAKLAELDGRLKSVDWSPKDLADGRSILIGRCPFEHDSKTSNFGDLATGIDDGVAWLKCLHASCERSREINAELKPKLYFKGRLIEPVVSRPSPAIVVEEKREVKIREVVEAEPAQFVSTVAPAIIAAKRGAFTLHSAGCGSGKTYGIATAAADRARRGLPTLVAVPTIEAAGAFINELFKVDSELAENPKIITKLYGLNRDQDSDEPTFDESDNAVADSYKVEDSTLIAIATHAQLTRRGFSRYIRGIYEAIGSRAVDVKSVASESGPELIERPAFSILIDELHSFLESCRFELRLAHRYKVRKAHDGRGYTRLTAVSCPEQTSSGNCQNCHFGKLAGERDFNAFSIPELLPVRSVRYNANDEPLSRPAHPVDLTLNDFAIGDWIRVDKTLFAASVESFRDMAIDTSRRFAEYTLNWRPDAETGDAPVEDPAEIVKHILAFGFRPVITKETPVDQDGNELDPETIRILKDSNRFRSDETFWPLDPCQVPTLRLIDLVAFERLKRFAEYNAVDVQGFTATSTDELIDVLSEVFGNGLNRVTHEPPIRKIEKLAIAGVDGYRTARGLAMDKTTRSIITRPLEAFSQVLIFAARKKQAVNLYQAVEGYHTGARLVMNRTAISSELSTTRIASAFRDDEPPKTIIHYARGPYATGFNWTGLRTLVVDCNAFRRISSFTPKDVTLKSFQESQAKERAAIVAQNIGRLLRGESGKVAVLILLNAEPPLIDALAKDEFIINAVVEPPIVTPRYSGLGSLIHDSSDWLHRNGVDSWKCSESNAKAVRAAIGVSNEKRTNERREKRELKRAATRERLRIEAAQAAGNGSTWKEFSRARHVDRYFDEVEIQAIRDLFKR